MCAAQTALQEKIYSPDQLTDLMAVSDYVVAATPYTPATDKLISAAAIAAMKPNGVFINVGRGKCVDEEALIEGETSMAVCTT
jgi:phosphoglycerate dehydrogenase-like enzyme